MKSYPKKKNADQDKLCCVYGAFDLLALHFGGVYIYGGGPALPGRLEILPQENNRMCFWLLRWCLHGGGPVLLVGLALFAEIPRLS